MNVAETKTVTVKLHPADAAELNRLVRKTKLPGVKSTNAEIIRLCIRNAKPETWGAK